MRRLSIAFTADAQGHLCVELPRATYWALAVVLGAAAALMATRWGRGVASGLEAPAWAWWGAMGAFAAFAAVFGTQALWGHALVFDARRAAIMRGERIVAPFADVSHVQLAERREEADRAGARLATALGKPVKFVVW